jgi:hypothetical protein
VSEVHIRPPVMTDVQRRQLVKKAKADSLAYDAARLLSLGETGQAVTAADQCVSIAGREQLALWLRHYATTRFQVPSRAVDEFLGNLAAANVAL